MFPKSALIKSLGDAVSLKYDVVDLSAWDFDKLLGGPVLRCTLRMLKRMIEGPEDDFPDDFFPLREILDEKQKIDLTRDILDFVAQAMAAHNRRLEQSKIDKTVKTVFDENGGNMIKTVFEEAFLEGEAIGVSKGVAISILNFLRTRFKKISKATCNRVLSITDLDKLNSLSSLAASCKSIEEFEDALN